MFYAYIDGQLFYRSGDGRYPLLSPKVKRTLGKAGSFSFRMPSVNGKYSELKQLKSTVTVHWDDLEIFRGRVIDNDLGFDTIRTVYCEGDLAYLIDSVQKGLKFDGTTHELFRRIVAAHNARVDAQKRFLVGVIGIENREIHLAGHSDDIEDLETSDFNYKQIAINSITDNWQSTYDHIETCLINYCGGYLRTRRVNGETYLDLIPDSGVNASQKIQFGKNLLDLTEKNNVDELFTVLIPLGDDNLTIETVNGGSDELVDAEGVEKYGRILRTHVFDSVTDPATLLENGRRYLENSREATKTITVQAVDLHMLNPDIQAIDIGDRVTIVSQPHNIQLNLVCMEIEYDLENPGNTVYVFGRPDQSLTDRYRKDKVKKNYSGGSGGGVGTTASEVIDSFFDAWINVDRTAGHVSLGTLYQDAKNLEEATASNRTQIELQSNKTSAFITLTTSAMNRMDGQITENSTAIRNLSESEQALIELTAAHSEQIDDPESGISALNAHYASLVLKANDLESSIEGHADRIELLANNQTKIAAELDAETDDDGNIVRIGAISSLEQSVERVETDLGTTTTAVSNLTARVGTAESGLLLKANSSDLNGYLTKTAAASIYVRDADVEAHIGAYLLSDGKTIADIKADIVTVAAKAAVINGLTARSSGGVSISGAVSTPTVMTEKLLMSSSGNGNFVIKDGSITGAQTISASKFILGGTRYTPQTITSTNGTVHSVLGAA